MSSSSSSSIITICALLVFSTISPIFLLSFYFLFFALFTCSHYKNAGWYTQNSRWTYDGFGGSLIGKFCCCCLLLLLEITHILSLSLAQVVHCVFYSYSSEVTKQQKMEKLILRESSSRICYT